MPLSLLFLSAAAIVFAYLLGSISFAVLVSAALGLTDPRSYGSKNPGATNVLRSGNKLAALLTLIGDAFKGWLAVWLAQHYAHRFGWGDWMIAAVALAVFIGHLYPAFLRFKGGKGVATAAGILLAMNPLLGALVIALWLAVVVLTRYSSLAAVIAALGAPVLAYVLPGKVDEARLIAIVIMSALLIYRHRANLGKLLAGSEHRIGAKPD